MNEGHIAIKVYPHTSCHKGKGVEVNLHKTVFSAGLFVFASIYVCSDVKYPFLTTLFTEQDTLFGG